MNVFTLGAVVGTTYGERESIFEDSDRFEEESLDSSTSEQDMSLITWRGWNTAANDRDQSFCRHETHKSGCTVFQPETLLEVCARKVAEHFPFEAIEKYNEPIPVDVQLRISFWSFPSAASDIRLYACLGNGNADEFNKGEAICAGKNSVNKMLQIGFHLSGQVTVPPSLGSLSNTVKPECITVSVTFDRKRITHTNCGCQSDIQWCRHVVALCLYRIEHPFKAEIRAPVSESLSRLQRDQLQKFAQYLISELPTQVLPTAQRLLDQLCGYTPSDVKIPIAERPETDPNLLSPSSMPINLIQGAPDPTAGPSIDDISMWTLDEDKLNSKLKRTLMKFVQIMPASVTDFGQVYPQSMTPPASSEFNTLLRPIRGKEPEPVWNLLSIVRELCMRQDPNSLLILDIITQQCVNIDSLVVWWFTSRTAAHYYPNSGNRSGNAGANRNRSSGSAVSSTVAGQQCCATLMDEIIDLWTLLILNPRLGSDEKGSLVHTMRLYHVYCIHKIQTNQGTCLQFKRNELRNFQGFKPVIKAAMSEFPAQFYTDSMFKYNRPVILTASQLLYTYPRVNNILETAQSVHETMLKRNQAAAAAAAEQARLNVNAGHHGIGGDPMVDQNNSSEMLMDDDDDYYDQEEDLNQSYEVDPVASEGAFHDSNEHHLGYPAFEHHHSNAHHIAQSGMGVQPSDSIDEGLDTSSRRESITSTGLRNSYGANLDFPPITHFNALMGNEGSNEASSSSSQRGGNGNLSASESTSRPHFQEDNLPPDTMPGSSRGGRDSSVPVGLVKHHKGVTSKNPAGGSNAKSGKNRVFDIFADLNPLKCNIELLHLLMESLHAHNFREQAFAVAVELADALVNNCPDLLADPPPHTRFRRKIRYELSAKACQILHKIVSVVNVLSEKSELKTLAFKLAVCGLEIARLPSPSKMFEVKMYHLETVILNQLRSITCGNGEMAVLREKAQHLAHYSHFRGRYLLPLHLAMVIFENLCCFGGGGELINPATGEATTSSEQMAADMELGVKATLAVLAMKPHVAEADNPLLCESIRRARSELTLSLLLKFRNDQGMLRDILNALLDQGPRRVEMSVSLSGTSGGSQSGPHKNKMHRASGSHMKPGATASSQAMLGGGAYVDDELYDFVMDSSESRSDSPFRIEDLNAPASNVPQITANLHPHAAAELHKNFRMNRIRSTSSGSDSNLIGAQHHYQQRHHNHQHHHINTNMSQQQQHTRRGAKRGSNVRNNSHTKDYSSERFVTYITIGDSNARSASSNSEAAFASSNVRDLALSSAENNTCNISVVPSNTTNANSKMTFALGRRWYRGKKCYSNVPVVPNQPSEAQAHSLMELAKQVLVKASASNSAGSALSAVNSGGPWSSTFNNSGGTANVLGGFGAFNNSNIWNLAGGSGHARNVTTDQNRPSWGFDAFQTIHFNNDTTTTQASASAVNMSGGDNNQSFGSASTATAALSSTQTDNASSNDASRNNNAGQDVGSHTFAFSNPLSSTFSTGFPGSSAGNNLTSLSSNRKVHSNLHMAAFEIGLHALCVLNCVSSNWLSRTYSTYESWIQTQTLEIGSPALSMLKERWVGILTPSEASGIAQKAGKVYESTVRNAGAELALSVLSHANSLNANEVLNCLEQCSEQGNELLEKACKCIEGVHEVASPVSGSTLAPQILFKVAKYYKKLHDHLAGQTANTDQVNQHTNQQQRHHHRRTNNANSAAPQQTLSATLGGYPGAHQVAIPSEEAQLQGARDMVQQDLQHYLVQQLMFPTTVFLNRPFAPPPPPPPPHAAATLVGNHQASNQPIATAPAPAHTYMNFFPPPSLQAAIQGQVPLVTHPNASATAATNSRVFQPTAASNMSNAQLVQTQANQQPIVPAATQTIVTQTRFSKRAFFNGIEAVKVMILRNTESKEEFSLNKSCENEEDLKWLISLTIQMGRPENIKVLIECVCQGVKNPFLMHNLTEFVLSKLQQHFPPAADFSSASAAGNSMARQHCLFTSFSAATWQRYLECLSRKLETLGTAAGQGDEDLLQTVTSMRTCAITQYSLVTPAGPSYNSNHHMANSNHAIVVGNSSAVVGQGPTATASTTNTVQRIGEMSRLIVAARNMRADLKDKIRTLFLVPT